MSKDDWKLRKGILTERGPGGWFPDLPMDDEFQSALRQADDTREQERRTGYQALRDLADRIGDALSRKRPDR